MRKWTPDWLRDAVAHPGMPLVRATIVLVGRAAATIIVLTSMKTRRDASREAIDAYRRRPLLLKRVLPPNPGRWLLRLLEVAALLAWAYFAVIAESRPRSHFRNGRCSPWW